MEGDPNELSYLEHSWDIITEIDKFLDDHKPDNGESNAIKYPNGELNTDLVPASVTSVPSIVNNIRRNPTEINEVEFIGKKRAIFEILEDNEHYGIYDYNPNETNWNVFYKTLPPGKHLQNIKNEPGTETICNNNSSANEAICKSNNLQSFTFQNAQNTNVNQQSNIKLEPADTNTNDQDRENIVSKEMTCGSISFDSCTKDNTSSNTELNNFSFRFHFGDQILNNTNQVASINKESSIPNLEHSVPENNKTVNNLSKIPQTSTLNTNSLIGIHKNDNEDIDFRKINFSDIISTAVNLNTENSQINIFGQTQDVTLKQSNFDKPLISNEIVNPGYSVFYNCSKFNKDQNILWKTPFSDKQPILPNLNIQTSTKCPNSGHPNNNVNNYVNQDTNNISKHKKWKHNKHQNLGFDDYPQPSKNGKTKSKSLKQKMRWPMQRNKNKLANNLKIKLQSNVTNPQCLVSNKLSGFNQKSNKPNTNDFKPKSGKHQYRQTRDIDRRFNNIQQPDLPITSTRLLDPTDMHEQDTNSSTLWNKHKKTNEIHDVHSVTVDTNNSKFMPTSVSNHPLYNVQQPALPFTSNNMPLCTDDINKQTSSLDTADYHKPVQNTLYNDYFTSWNNQNNNNQLQNLHTVINYTNNSQFMPTSVRNHPLNNVQQPALPFTSNNMPLCTDDINKQTSSLDTADYHKQVQNTLYNDYFTSWNNQNNNNQLQNLHTVINYTNNSQFIPTSVSNHPLYNVQQPVWSFTSNNMASHTGDIHKQTSSLDTAEYPKQVQNTLYNDYFTSWNNQNNNNQLQNLHTVINYTNNSQFIPASVPDYPLNDVQQPVWSFTSNNMPSHTGDINKQTSLFNPADFHKQRSTLYNEYVNDIEIQNVHAAENNSKNSLFIPTSVADRPLNNVQQPTLSFTASNDKPSHTGDIHKQTSSLDTADCPKQVQNKVNNSSTFCNKHKNNNEMQNVHSVKNDTNNSQFKPASVPDRPLNNLQQSNVSLTSTKKKPLYTEDMYTKITLLNPAVFHQLILDRSILRKQLNNNNRIQNAHAVKNYRNNSQLIPASIRDRILKNKPLNTEDINTLANSMNPADFHKLVFDKSIVWNKNKNNKLQNVHIVTNDRNNSQFIPASVPDRPLNNFQQSNLLPTSTNNKLSNTEDIHKQSSSLDSSDLHKQVKNKENNDKSMSLNKNNKIQNSNSLLLENNSLFIPTSLPDCSLNNVQPPALSPTTSTNKPSYTGDIHKQTSSLDTANCPKQVQNTQDNKSSTFWNNHKNNDTHNVHTVTDNTNNSQFIPTSVPDHSLNNAPQPALSLTSSNNKPYISTENIHKQTSVFNSADFHKQRSELYNEHVNDIEIQNVNAVKDNSKKSPFISKSGLDCSVNKQLVQQPALSLTSSSNKSPHTSTEDKLTSSLNPADVHKQIQHTQVINSSMLWNKLKNNNEIQNLLTVTNDTNNPKQSNLTFTSTNNKQSDTGEIHESSHLLGSAVINSSKFKNKDEVQNLQTTINNSEMSQCIPVSVRDHASNTSEQPNLPVTSTNNKLSHISTEKIQKPISPLNQTDFHKQVQNKPNINSSTLLSDHKNDEVRNTFEQPNLPFTSTNNQPSHTYTGDIHTSQHVLDSTEVQHKEHTNCSELWKEYKKSRLKHHIDSTKLPSQSGAYSNKYHKEIQNINKDQSYPFMKSDNTHRRHTQPQKKTEVIGSQINGQNDINDNCNDLSAKEIVNNEYNVIKDYLSPETLVGCTVKFSSRKLANTLIREQIQKVLSTHGVLENSWWTPDDLYFITYKTRNIAQYVFKLYPMNRTSSY